jgi:putative ABC transport system permease protein
MIKHNLKVARRSLAKHKADALIMTVSLAAGAAACLLISLYVEHELGYDTYHKDGERVFRLLVASDFTKGKPSASTSELAAPTLMSDFPEVERAARLQRLWRPPLVKREDEAFAEDRLFYADQELFDVLTVRFARGRREGALSRPGTMVVTPALAAS